MDHRSLGDFLRDRPEVLARGPVAMIFAEDQVEVESTVRHHLHCGFSAVLLLGLPNCRGCRNGCSPPCTASPMTSSATSPCPRPSTR